MSAVGGDGEDNTIGGTSTLCGPEELGAFCGRDNSAVVEYVFNGLEVIHRCTKMAGAGAKVTPDSGTGETNVSAADVGEWRPVVSYKYFRTGPTWELLP